jgi:MoaA/NifB/PqqE/SkfB family radical SAM enzyme
MLGIITTNGTLWNSELVEKTVQIGWDRVHLSIDGPDAKTHDYLRNVPGTFKKVINTIKLFHRFKKRYRTDRPMLNMNTVLSIKNYKKLSQMVKFAHKMGLEYMFIDPLIVYSKEGERLKLKERHLKEFPIYLQRAIEVAERYKIPNNFSGLDKNLSLELIEKSSRMHEVVRADIERAQKIELDGFIKGFIRIACYKPWWHMTIKCDGRTTSCDVPIIGGDSIRDKSINEVWHGPYFRALRGALKNAKIPRFCAQCNPSHTTQRRRLRLEIIKMLEPKLESKLG